MSNATKEFKQCTIAVLEELSDQFQLSEIEMGDDDIIARARLGCIKSFGSKPVLQLRRRNDLLGIEIRHLAFVGASCSITNITTAQLSDDVAQMLFGEKELTRQDQLLHVMAVNAFQGRSQTVWELMAHIVLQSNNYSAENRSVLDFRKGEVFVDSVLDCDFEIVPELLEDRLKSIVSHACLLCDILLIVRKISNEPTTTNELSQEFNKIQQLLTDRVVGAKKDRPDSETDKSDSEEELLI